jgi:hypothetical protein
MIRGGKVFGVYGVLLMLSLPVPLLHHFQTGKFIESQRPYFTPDHGEPIAMLLPAQFLFYRYMGDFSEWIPPVILAMFLLSFQKKIFARRETLCAIAICQCAFATLYATYSAFLLIHR